MTSNSSITRRALLVAAATVPLAGRVRADAYPSRPVTLLVPLAAGSLADLIARALANDLSQRLGQPVIVENRPGAGEVIAATALLRSAPNGYTLMLTMAPNVVAPSVQRTLQYKSIGEFAAIAYVASAAGVLVVGPNITASNARELTALLKAKPNQYKYGSSGVGSMMHLAMEMFGHETKTTSVHVPYKSFQALVPDIVSGQIDMALLPLSTATQFAAKGQLKIIGAQTLQRFPEEPAIPTLDEQGLKGYDTSIHYAIISNKTTPAPIVETLTQAVNAVVASPAYATKLKVVGGLRPPATPLGSKETAELLMREETRWRKFINDANIAME